MDIKTGLRQTKSQQDLGLGSKVSQEQKTRFINRDGSFNVGRKNHIGWGEFSPYHTILALSWPQFFILIFSLFILANLLFAYLYLLAGPDSFPWLAGQTQTQRYMQLFLSSVQTLSIPGSTSTRPATTISFIILDLESTVALLGFALTTALIFARFSNPATRIIFSDKAVIAPYNDITGFMFRIINGRRNELIEVSASVTLVVTKEGGKRQFQQLPLERDMVLVFPLNWTIVHPIDQDSPLRGMTSDDLAETNMEFLISITAFDKDLSKRVYARFSYLYNEVVVGARFSTMIDQAPDGRVLADPDLIHNIEKP